MDPLPVPSATATDDPLSSLFEAFLADRRYLKNVTPSTLEWHRQSFLSYQRVVSAVGRGPSGAGSLGRQCQTRGSGRSPRSPVGCMRKGICPTPR